jgi:hypothetical protein
MRRQIRKGSLGVTGLRYMLLANMAQNATSHTPDNYGAPAGTLY